MELYKIMIGNEKKKFYESKEMFERFWTQHSNWYTQFCDVVAYTIDWETQEWVEIRRQNKEKESK